MCQDMASEGGGGGDVQLQPRNPPVLPQYPEMIIGAIRALNNIVGSNKSAISKQIEGTYGNLPPAHKALLSHHLGRMRAAGQLHFVKNNYVIPDPNAPPRRGRGRPPKRPRDPAARAAAPAPLRPRGSPQRRAEGGESVAGKKRGRPRKPAGDVPPAVKRGRGRPPKLKSQATATTVGGA